MNVINLLVDYEALANCLIEEQLTDEPIESLSIKTVKAHLDEHLELVLGEECRDPNPRLTQILFQYFDFNSVPIDHQVGDSVGALVRLDQTVIKLPLIYIEVVHRNNR